MGLSNKVIVLNHDGMGHGDPVLGQTILASFLRLCQQSAEKPRAIFLYNGGVKLLTAESPVLAHLQELAGMSVPIQACKTCVDSFGIRDQLQAGEVSTMGQLVEHMQQYEIVTL